MITRRSRGTNRVWMVNSQQRRIWEELPLQNASEHRSDNATRRGVGVGVRESESWFRDASVHFGKSSRGLSPLAWNVNRTFPTATPCAVLMC
jgi:hypothetical protein